MKPSMPVIKPTVLLGEYHNLDEVLHRLAHLSILVKTFPFIQIDRLYQVRIVALQICFFVMWRTCRVRLGFSVPVPVASKFPTLRRSLSDEVRHESPCVCAQFYRRLA